MVMAVNQRIAFIGVGRMGGRMTKRLLDAGYDVAVYDPDETAVSALVALDAAAAHSPAEAADGADFVLCSVPNPDILREAVTRRARRAPSPAR